MSIVGQTKLNQTKLMSATSAQTLKEFCTNMLILGPRGQYIYTETTAQPSAWAACSMTTKLNFTAVHVLPYAIHDLRCMCISQQESIRQLCSNTVIGTSNIPQSCFAAAYFGYKRNFVYSTSLLPSNYQESYRSSCGSETQRVHAAARRDMAVAMLTTRMKRLSIGIKPA